MKKYGLKIAFGFITPLVFSILSIVLGIFYALGNQVKWLHLMTYFIPPIVFFIQWYIQYTLLQRQQKSGEYKIKTKEQHVKEWVSQFSFLTPEDLEIKIYLSKQEAVGRVHVYYTDEEQKNTIQDKASELDARLHLSLFPKMSR